MGGYVNEAMIFLIRTLFGLYLLAVALRFLLAWVRADYYNPVSQLIVTLTNPPLRPLRRILPGYGGVDWSSVVLLLALKTVEIVLVALAAGGRIPALPGLFVISVAELIRLVLYIFMFAIFVQVILSWVNPGAYNPVTVIIYRLSEPILAPARRLLPPMGGLDFSPFLALVVLQLTIILLVKPLEHLGLSLS